ncbi:MAG TPA: endospore germination permease [Candidatus Sulfotelmatobacter sp.]|nr:endospore germination permease [Candidatus Sulfotelmatobacter sp.]HWI65867.1 endospore germination permease [Symbiobacteriaceae bacterium]
MKRWEISALQQGMLIAAVCAVSGHALAVTHFLRVGGRDAWWVGIFAWPVAAVSIACWYGLRKIFPYDTLVQYLPKVLGYAGYPLAAFYSLYFFTVVVFTLRSTTDWMVDSILTETPSWVMGTLYMAAVVYAAMGGLDVLARVSQFTLPLLAANGMFVAVSTGPAKDYRLLTPFFENGLPPLLAVTVLGLGYYGESCVMAMTGAYVRKDERTKVLKANLLALLFMVTTFSGPLAGSVATLGYRVAQNMAYPTFQHWLMVSFPRFFERTDLLAVHQWLAGGYTRCGLYLLMAVHGCRQLAPKIRIKERTLVAIAGLLAVLASEYAFPHKPAFDAFVIDLYLPVGAYLGILFPVLLYVVARARGLHKQAQGAPSHGA